MLTDKEGKISAVYHNFVLISKSMCCHLRLEWWRNELGVLTLNMAVNSGYMCSWWDKYIPVHIRQLIILWTVVACRSIDTGGTSGQTSFFDTFYLLNYGIVAMDMRIVHLWYWNLMVEIHLHRFEIMIVWLSTSVSVQVLINNELNKAFNRFSWSSSVV